MSEETNEIILFLLILASTFHLLNSNIIKQKEIDALKSRLSIVEMQNLNCELELNKESRK